MSKKTSKVECTLCPKACQLVEGQRGDCRARINLDGKLQTLVYGKPCSFHVDPIEKKPLYHVLPGSGAFSIATAGCNLHCKNCQNWEISQAEPEDVRYYDLPPEKVVELTINKNCNSVAYTYTEPNIFYEYVYDTAVIARKNNILNLMITAGYINEEPLRELAPYVDAANVDLKAFDEQFYKDVCDGELKVVLNSLKIYKELGTWLEITNLIIPTLNDDMEMISKMCGWILENLGTDYPLHFSAFTPRYQMQNLPRTPEDILTKARERALELGLHNVYVGNVGSHPGSHTYCPNCKKVVIYRQGYAVNDNGIDDGKCKYCKTDIAGIWKIKKI